MSPKSWIKLISSNPQRPPIAEYVDGKWIIKTDYPDPNSLAGSCTVLSADGSISQLTFDDEGYIIREVNVSKSKTKD